MEVKENIAKILSMLPNKPGVYIMKDALGKIIYVGKAVVLKNRVRSYFRKDGQKSVKTQALVQKVEDIETIVTANELEALILECNLIKKHRPKYNICLKDDKTYPYLKITTQEAYPRVYVTRRVMKDGAKYYGPYADVGALREIIRFIKMLYPLRTCRNMNSKRPCLQYHIKRCLAPCAGMISITKYQEMIVGIEKFLEGKSTALLRELKEKMQAASEALQFEEAAGYRDTLRALERIHAQQNITTDSGERDIIAIAKDALGYCVQMFFVRQGKLLGRDSFFLPLEAGEKEEEIMVDVLKQYYFESNNIPREILLNLQIAGEEQDVIAQWLSDKAGRKVVIEFPQRGTKKELVAMAINNAQKNLMERWRKGQLAHNTGVEAAKALQTALGLVEPIVRMDCFDISHTQGSETVASMVVFIDGKAAKKEYRRFKIQSAEGKPDDFKSMQEVVYRRYSKVEEMPDLIVIDGGKGQLSSALEVIRGLGYHEVPVIGLAERDEEVFMEGESDSLKLEKSSVALQLLQQIRDEAHRFAITYHRKLRTKRNLVSVLDNIPGIGAKRRANLWKEFGDLENMKAATEEELAAVEGMNAPAAARLYNFFREDVLGKKEILKN